MGRAFEYRKARKLKRWGNMSRTFTRIGKEITIAAKAGGPDPDTNPRLAYLIGEYLAKALKIATEAQTVGLHAYIAHLGKVLAYKRGLKIKIMYYHSR